MKKRVILTLTLVAVFLLTLIGPAAAQEFEPNIVDIAAADGRFDVLHTAIVEAGLADTLASADNTFTVFAPTDDAFAQLPPALLNALLADPGGALTQILLYHVVPGELTSGDVLASDTLTTLQGGTLDVNMQNGMPYVNDSQIIVTDVQAKNGVIHVIDAVLVPDIELPAVPTEEMTMVEATPEETVEPTTEMAEPVAEQVEETVSGETLPTIAEVALANGNFDTLLAALEAAGLAETFAQPGNYTVFAPTDDAFAAIPEARLNQLLSDPQGELTDILLYHVVGDELSRDQIATDDLIPTLDGRPLFVNTDANLNVIDISGARVLIWNIPASNGIIHVIDRVLVP